ncbi:helix-turn-helix domain-containing protein [Streptomyces sp. NPDC017056]|uniref:helix-turn-helix domain-containing protein n=1 Tax=Streptomyces sp. NPDC017056 TaxID=3364973 RepID=UPI0037954AE6
MTAGQATQSNSTSTVLGRRLGGELLALRTAAGLTQPQAAQVLSASTAKVAKLERGWVPIRDPDIRALCDLYGVRDPRTVGGLLELARIDRERRKAKGWWTEFPGIGAMQEYVALENAATTVKAWQLAFVPGLLQSPDYVRALNPEDSFVSARVARQQRLMGESPLTLHAVVFEAALRTLTGGRDTMRRQLEHLATMAQRPNVNVRVLPFSAGTQPGMGCAFNILSFAEPGAMDIVYMEIPHNELWREGGQEAGVYGTMFENIERNALTAEGSLAFITSLSKEL